MFPSRHPPSYPTSPSYTVDSGTETGLSDSVSELALGSMSIRCAFRHTIRSMINARPIIAAVVPARNNNINIWSSNKIPSKPTQEELPEHLAVVQRTGARFITNCIPHQAGVVHHGTVNYRTRHITKEADGKLNDSHRHRFVCERDEGSVSII